MRVIVDAGIGNTSPLWQQFQAWLGPRSADIVWPDTRYPAMPDVEILDKLMAPDAFLLTRDRVLHNRALAQGLRSFTLNARGQLTRRPLPLAQGRLRAQAPSVLKALKPSYQHVPHPLALALSANRPPRQLKTQRTRRRRIRSTFGAVDNIARVAWTIGARPYQDRLPCGYVMHVHGYRGVKGLRASEGYGVDRAMAPAPAQSLVFALCEVFQLHLEAIPHELFIISPAAYELAREAMGPSDAPDSPLGQALYRLFQATAQMQISSCVNGRFYDQMQRKLDQLATAPTKQDRPSRLWGYREAVRPLIHAPATFSPFFFCSQATRALYAASIGSRTDCDVASGATPPGSSTTDCEWPDAAESAKTAQSD